MQDSSEEKYDGYLDTASPYKVFGWAANMADFSAHVGVEFVLNDIVVGKSKCNFLREDLALVGVGTGDHGFSFKFNPPLPSLPEGKLIVRIAGTEFQLKNSPWPMPMFRGFDIIAADIVDNCNLRCPFCLFDYSKIKSTHKMSKETFARLIDLAQYVEDGQFFVSCLHEPTLHPEFIEFLEMIPEHLRQKAFFTTNNCRKISDDYIDRLANTNLHHVNVSFDTRDPELFSFLRKGGNYEVFLDNTYRMAHAFMKNPRAPKLRFIIMAFKSNMNDIPDLIRFCHNEFRANDVEVRYTFEMPHISKEFFEKHVLTIEKWDELVLSLKEVKECYSLLPPPENYNPLRAEKWNVQDTAAESYIPVFPPPLPIQLRVSWDGTIQVIGWEKHFTMNINMSRNPYTTLISL